MRLRASYWMTAVFLAACTGHTDVQVAGARLAMADGVRELLDAPNAAVVGVKPGTAWQLPAAHTIHVAVDRETSFGEVANILRWNHVNPDKRTLTLLVKTRRDDIRAIDIPATPAEPRIRVVAYADGKTCVSLPNVEQAKCVKSRIGNNADRSYTRALVREAKHHSGLTRVGVEIEPVLSWANAVRVIDGARTCCDTHMTVGVMQH